jgi:hypothetical protein
MQAEIQIEVERRNLVERFTVADMEMVAGGFVESLAQKYVRTFFTVHVELESASCLRTLPPYYRLNSALHATENDLGVFDRTRVIGMAYAAGNGCVYWHNELLLMLVIYLSLAFGMGPARTSM